VASLSAGGNSKELASAHSGSSGEVNEASVMLGAKEMAWGSLMSEPSKSNQR
jgi:hypothetical protein